MTKRLDLIENYIAKGLSAEEAILQLKADHPEYDLQNFDRKGRPTTFEGHVSRNVRYLKMTPDQAVATAKRDHPDAYENYLWRLKRELASEETLKFAMNGEHIK
jgi:hypothetical protein